MKINSWEWRNIGSYGNKKHKIELKNEGSLNMIMGSNGSGKCLDPHTEIDVFFEDSNLEEKFLNFINKDNHDDERI